VSVDFLSIDFDFFVWNGVEARERDISFLSKQTGKKETIPSVYLFDWGHSESFSSEVQDFIWQARYDAFAAVGVDPFKVCDAHAHKGTVSIDSFLNSINKRFYFAGDYEFFYADSHAHGYSALQEAYCGEPLNVVHFDAHGDLGYDSSVVANEKKRGVLDCGSWLYHGVSAGLVESVTIVYPDWKGLAEFSSNGFWEPPEHIVALESCGSVHFTCWSDWVAREAERSRVSTVFSCRSSAWTPPWMDFQAETLFDGLSGGEGVCLDCNDGYQKIGGHDACKKRSFSLSPNLMVANNT